MPITRSSISTTLALLLVALTLTSCGDSTDAATSPSSDTACLSPHQIEAQVNEIAAGVETSSADVEQKQQAIAAIHAKACP